MLWITLAALVLCFQGCTPKKFATQPLERIPSSQASNSSAEVQPRDQEKSPPPDKTGRYTSQIVVKDRCNGQILFRSAISQYELLPGS